jgi:hypothetical protein
MITVVCKNGNITYYYITPAEFFDKMYRRELGFTPSDIREVDFDD